MKNISQKVHGKNFGYKSAGVDINAGNELIKKISPLANATHRPGTLNNLGGFGALFDLKAAGYNDPILVAATDGVGTKLKIAVEMGLLETIGIDLVAMCVNDLICQGAEPLFFLDYFATAKLNVTEATSVIKGISAGCLMSNISLIGGETAEMPGIYAKGDFDLAGFAVGALNRGDILPKGIQPGDKILSLASSGIHSNGYSLVRMVVKNLGLSWHSKAPFSDNDLGTELLKPTKIYVKPILSLLKKGLVKGVAHITGGGITENVPRILGETFGATINLDALQVPKILKWLFSESKIQEKEALKTFNCGAGMVLVVKEDKIDEVKSVLEEYNEGTSIIGEIKARSGIKYNGTLFTD